MFSVVQAWAMKVLNRNRQKPRKALPFSSLCAEELHGIRGPQRLPGGGQAVGGPGAQEPAPRRTIAPFRVSPGRTLSRFQGPSAL